MSDCWCNETHPERTDDPLVAWRTLTHLLIGRARLPELMRWLIRT